jgi:heat shock protein HslJ
MKITKFATALIILGLMTIVACQKTNESEEKTSKNIQSKTELDDVDKNAEQPTENENNIEFYGIYKGILPCADCEGISTKITLLSNGTFKRSMTYLGKSDQKFYDNGNYEWNKDASTLTLTSSEGSVRQYEIGDNSLYHLDNQGNRITGDLAENYMLLKNKTDTALENKTWVLVELMGQAIVDGENTKEMYMMFISENGTLAGFDGCNRFTGGYELLEGNRYKSGPFATTRMACVDMENSRKFIQAVEKSDTYMLTDSTLSITKARMAVLAKFKLKEE